MGCLSAEAAPKATTNPLVLEDDADVVVYHIPKNDDRRMEVSIGPPKGGKPREVIRRQKFSTTSKELAEFFDEQPRKNLIVIIFEKNVLEEVECMAIATTLRDYFVARGYKQISIRQATNGLSRPVYIDYKESRREAPNGP